MNSYDIVFIGQLGRGTVVPFRGSPFLERGGPAFFGPIAASCLAKKTATVMRVAGNEDEFLEPLKAAGVDVFLLPGEVHQYRVVFPTANADERQVFYIKGAGYFSIEDIPSLEPCLMHLGGLYVREFTFDFMQELKTRGFRLSVDMQSFVSQVDYRSGLVHLDDVPEKREILSMVDFVKLDIVEAKALTGADVPQDQADVLEDWGGSEIIITSSEGALVRSKGKTVFTKFTNRSVQGRMGRGDTFMGAYLARRLDHPVEDSARLAVALTSIKLESPGPFSGSVEDVIERMNANS